MKERKSKREMKKETDSKQIFHVEKRDIPANGMGCKVNLQFFTQ